MKTRILGAVLGAVLGLVGCGGPVDLGDGTGGDGGGATADGAPEVVEIVVEACDVNEEVGPGVVRKLAAHVYDDLDAEQIAAHVTAAGVLGGDAANKIQPPPGAMLATDQVVFAEDGTARVRCDMMTGAGPAMLFTGVQFTRR